MHSVHVHFIDETIEAHRKLGDLSKNTPLIAGTAGIWTQANWLQSPPCKPLCSSASGAS